MSSEIICLYCGFRFDGNQCPLCAWELSDSGDRRNEHTETRITLVFEQNREDDLNEILHIAQNARFFSNTKDGSVTRYYATYLPEQANELFKLFEKVETNHRLQILINGKIRPYARNLWLPLLWFFTSAEYTESGGVRNGN